MPYMVLASLTTDAVKRQIGTDKQVVNRTVYNISTRNLNSRVQFTWAYTVYYIVPKYVTVEHIIKH